ncbi:MAG: Ger(x)C family spore germination protein [Bacteroidota bacterium]
MSKKTLKITLFISSLFIISGCWGQREIDEAAYVLAIGLDRAAGNNIRISVLAGTGRPNLPVATEQGMQTLAVNKVRTFTTEASGFFSGLNSINTILERQMELGHIKTIVFGEELAKTDLQPYFDLLTRWRKFRRTLYLAVAQGEARRVIESIIPPNEDNPAKFLELMFISQGHVGFTPRNQMLWFYNALKTKGEDPVAALVAPRANKYQLGNIKADPLPSNNQFAGATGDPGEGTAGNSPLSGEGSLQFLGTAVFRKGMMAGKLNGNETMALSMIRGELSRIFLVIPDRYQPGSILQIEISQKQRPEILVKKNGAKVEAGVRLELSADIIGIEAGQSYELPGNMQRIERSAEVWIEEQCRSVLNKAQALGTDIFGFGHKARWLVADWNEWQAWDWRAAFRQMPVKLQVRVHAPRTGLIIRKNAVREGD